ncbi:TolC family protein [Pseudomonas phoenicis]|uniref:TolC family protein n=1 Tax=unclassified Pseudomonas TaxID=196821 RepID=UPI0039A0C3D4
MRADVFKRCLLALMCTWASCTDALDMFSTDAAVAPAAVLDGIGLGAACADGALPEVLSLEIMVERVLCHDPQVRYAWAQAKAQAAQVGIARSAYLPRLDATSSYSRGHNATHYEQTDSSEGRQRQLDHRLSLSWVLFDSGQREANVRNARQLLVAANANQNERLQEAFVQAASLYYEALAAQDRQRAAEQVAALATENLKDASAKFDAGAAALSDRLQAQTAYSQASLDLIRGQGVMREAEGQIAVRMGLAPQTRLILAQTLTRRPDTTFVKGLDTLLEQAGNDHPALISARAKLEAAKSAVAERQAAGRPSLSLVASLSDIKTHQSMAFDGDSHIRDNSVGLQVSIPLFEGFGPSYQVRGARARVQAQEAELDDARQRVALELWASYQALGTETQALNRTAEWVEQAVLALTVIQGRYRSGVGSMIELLNASSAYAMAEQEHIAALNGWHRARLRLAASLGRLGFWAI